MRLGCRLPWAHLWRLSTFCAQRRSTLLKADGEGEGGGAGGGERRELWAEESESFEAVGETQDELMDTGGFEHFRALTDTADGNSDLFWVIW